MSTLNTRLNSTEVADALKVISDPTRLLMMKLISKKEYCVCQFVDMFEISQPAVSQHIRKLKQAGVVEEDRRGQWRFYSMDRSAPKVAVIQAILDQIDDYDQQYLELLKKETPVDCC
ncbi:winged helix-turn-helix transcriptional regulator [Salicibibacter cibi]|uniref:Winged helix-turn-helix transcriptional regulator n=1 Tax=Salicibibacter cibi TaxID=2743001 RepID=A0A7T7CEL7_9BACI|nr:metalloregulator ArsR/SmtB family transcription factor [Salicibibacter cibi]QQK79188.1 winged helix-turn-helix transcriptional regulator [Salicibibacter cibi]